MPAHMSPAMCRASSTSRTCFSRARIARARGCVDTASVPLPGAQLASGSAEDQAVACNLSSLAFNFFASGSGHPPVQPGTHCCSQWTKRELELGVHSPAPSSPCSTIARTRLRAASAIQPGGPFLALFTPKHHRARDCVSVSPLSEGMGSDLEPADGSTGAMNG